MDKIASIIRHQREQLRYSIEDVSKKTKLTTPQIDAVEKGNIAFFKDDITYFPFIIRALASALEIDYNVLRSDVEQVVAGFHATQAMKKVQQREYIHQSINNKVVQLGKKKRLSIDFTYVALVVILVSLLLALLFTFITVILPQLGARPHDNPIVELPTDPGNDVIENPVVPIEPGVVIEIEEVDFNRYVIRNFDSESHVVFRVTALVRPSWIRFTLNNALLTLPATATYPVNQPVVYEIIPTHGDVVSIRFGDMVAQNIEVVINDQPLQLHSRFDSRVSNGGNSGSLTFEFIGE